MDGERRRLDGVEKREILYMMGSALLDPWGGVGEVDLEDAGQSENSIRRSTSGRSGLHGVADEAVSFTISHHSTGITLDPLEYESLMSVESCVKYFSSIKNWQA
jgi:hypothetical protein